VLFASEQMDEPQGWRMLEPGELVHVDLDLRATSSVVLDEAPAHLVRLEDLDPRAAASNHNPERSTRSWTAAPGRCRLVERERELCAAAG
jgi:hypothetical protein